MKKLISAVCLISMLVSMLAVSTFAAPKDDVIGELDKTVPVAVESKYRTQGINILNQVEVNSDQSSQLIALIDEATSRVNLIYDSLHQYTSDERTYLVGVFDRACAILQLTYTIEEKTDVKGHDEIFHLYDKNGKYLAALDGDTVNQTGGTETDTARNLTIVVLMLAVLTAASVAYAAKKSVSDNV